MVFELLQIEVQCSKNYFKILLPQEGGTFGKNRKKNRKSHRPNLKKYLYYKFTENIFSAFNPMQVVVFCKMY